MKGFERCYWATRTENNLDIKYLSTCLGQELFQGEPKEVLHIAGMNFTILKPILFHLYLFVANIFVQKYLCTFV